MPHIDQSILVIDPASAEWEGRSTAPIFRGEVAAAAAAAVADSITGMAGTPVQSSIVRFQPGAHTVLHTHEGDQLLVITEGEGHIGTPDRDFPVRAGMVVVIPAGLEHYHGASSDESMAHLTVLAGGGTALGDDLPWPPVGGVS